MKGIVTILGAATALTTLLDDGANSVFELDIPQGAKAPLVLVDTGDLDPLNTASPTVMDEVQIRVFSVSKYLYNSGSNIGAYEIAEQVRIALDGYKGTAGGDTYSKVTLESQSPAYTGNQRVEIEQIYQVFKQR